MWGEDSGRHGGQISDRDVVDSVLRELSDAADKWEALVAQAENVKYAFELGDIQAVTNADGRLVDLSIHSSVMLGYSNVELTSRLNVAIHALRTQTEADNRLWCDGYLH